MDNLTDKLRSLIGKDTSAQTKQELELAHAKIQEKNRRLKKLRERLEAKDFELERMRAHLAERSGVKHMDAPTGSIKPENIVWIIGSGRTGSTWLAAMMEEITGHAVWFEPRISGLLIPNPPRLAEGKAYVFANKYKEVWTKNVRDLVLDGANARFRGAEMLVIKEPGGSAGAPSLLGAFPESRLIFLIRDPRDVVASWLDASREGGWVAARGGRVAPGSQEEHTRKLATSFAENVEGAKRAYDAHDGSKVLIKYEDLRMDTLQTMKRMYLELGIDVYQDKLAQAVRKHSWDKLPEEKKGEGKFYRKATPGGWREDLTPEQVRIVEEIAAPLLDEFYPGTRQDAGHGSRA